MKGRTVGRRWLAWIVLAALLGSIVPGSAATADEVEDSSPTIAAQSGVVALRAEPTLDSDVVAELDDGTPLSIVGSLQDDEGNRWDEVQVALDAEGSVLEGYLLEEFVAADAAQAPEAIAIENADVAAADIAPIAPDGQLDQPAAPSPAPATATPTVVSSMP